MSDNLHLYLNNLQSMKQYPKIGKHTRNELQANMNHCLSVLWQMAQGRKIGYAYDEKFIRKAAKEVTRALIEAVQRTDNQKIVDSDSYKVLYPLMTLAQRHRFQTDKTPVLSQMRILSKRPQPLLT